ALCHLLTLLFGHAAPLAKQDSDRRNHRNRITLAHPPHRDARMHTTGHARRKGNQMSNHFSADNFKFPGDDRRLDLTDVFMFTSADDPDKTVLIMDSNPTSAPPPIPAPTTGPEFYPGAVYRINIDNDGDNLADVAFT